MKFINLVNPVNPVKKGFSLTEMLIATGIMAIGLVMVATIFPVGVKLTTLTTERTVGAVAADEAFAKVQLYGLRDFSLWSLIAAGSPKENCLDFQWVSDYRIAPGSDGIWGTNDDPPLSSVWSEFVYPSTPITTDQGDNYYWSALCRQVESEEVQITTFINRKIGGAGKYYAVEYDPVLGTNHANDTGTRPQPVYMNVRFNHNNLDPAPRRELVIDLSGVMNMSWDNNLKRTGVVYNFIVEGSTILNNRDGKIYRVVEMKDVDGDNIRETIVLQQDWEWIGYDANPLNPPTTAQWATIWVVPPAVGSDRYPCVGVYQKVIRFDEIK